MACAYVGSGYIRTHRDIAMINAMCAWVKLTSVPGASLGIEHCAQMQKKYISVDEN